MSYASADTPRTPDERYNKLAQETSKGIASFNQVTRSIAQKMSLFGTPQDSRANHQQLKELSEKGNKLVAKINKRLHELNKACVGTHARSRKTQVGKLSSDFKNQLKTFEQTCQKLMESEKNSVDMIRRSSTSFKHGQKLDFNNYNEDQLYAQANVITYDEEDLARREEDIIHINHQLREVNAAFKEIDGLVEDQGEVVVEIAENTDAARDNVDRALENVRQADEKTSYCKCSKMKLMCYGGLIIVIAVLGISLAMAFSK